MSSPLRMRHLDVLLAVAAEGSMQRAAQRVHLTQPAISKLVREMETMFGATLFERSKRGVMLTESGRALAIRAEYLRNDMDNAREEVAAIARGTLGSLRIGALPVAESRLLPKSLMALRRIAPDLRVRVHDGTGAALLGSLRRGELDCVIGRLDSRADGKDLVAEKLLRLPTRIVARRQHPLAAKRRLRPEDLASYPWVLPQPGAPIRTVIDGIFAAAGIAAPVPIVESTSIRLNYELVRSSDMIGVMPDDAATAYKADRALAILSFELGDRLPYVGVMRRTAPPSHALSLFLRLLRETCG
ncbi:LysR substrate-binding domain-containing protein [Pseudorhodoplanes sp.]|uniref:LysR substrate-binding domain-containing protein n=1 Tax=Pseudorhodoplanes sp. TaxID=1934341 RepID=UPI003D113B9A